jgi:putative component of toxin-antitoxin plasmid stabilization module
MVFRKCVFILGQAIGFISPARTGDEVYVLLCGGTKRGQQRDIARAQELARQLKEN